MDWFIVGIVGLLGLLDCFIVVIVGKVEMQVLHGTRVSMCNTTNS